MAVFNFFHNEDVSCCVACIVHAAHACVPASMGMDAITCYCLLHIG